MEFGLAWQQVGTSLDICACSNFLSIQGGKCDNGLALSIVYEGYHSHLSSVNQHW